MSSLTEKVPLLAVCALVGSIASCTAEAADDPHERLARNIVKESGIEAGLCVHLGVTDGKLTAALAEEGRFIVHGIAPTAEATGSVRRYLQSRHLHGTVSVEQGALSRLPYVSNLVNLLVVEDGDEAVKAGLSLDEVMRVLCPGGAAYLGKKNGPATLKRKERPAATDEWTHWLHGPEGNNNSSDSVSRPSQRLQWIDGPLWLTSYNISELFAGERSFNIMRNPRDNWTLLVARDAYNGIELWRRQIQLGARSCNPRTIVATDQRVFVVLKEGDPLAALDAATGEALQTYDVGFSPLSVIHHDGNLVIAGENEICSVYADSGEVRWRKKAPGDSTFVLRHVGLLPRVLYQPPYVVSGGGRLFVMVKDSPKPPHSLVSYDLSTGEEQWRKQQPGEILAFYRKVLVLYEMHATTKPERKRNEELGRYYVVSAEDGRKLWERPHKRTSYHGVWDDPTYGGGLIWINEMSMGAKGYRAFDPVTGKQVRELKGAPRAHCGRIATTPNYIMGTMSIFFSLDTGKRFSPGFYKNGCFVGQLPANGLVYTFPISCSCIAYLRGHVALAPSPADGPDAPVEAADQLVKGPAYGNVPQPADSETPEWHTYRRDVARSGATPESLPRDLKVLWSTAVVSQQRTRHGRTITPPVVAEGRVFVAMPDAQQVSALNATTGEMRWSYLVGARVEAPPTIHRGLCLFGANDGWAYCLRASDGELVWRFRTSPEERRIVAYRRVESPWPVPGVLVTGGVAYFAGGRHGKTEDGLLIYALDPFTGKILWKNRVDNSKLEVWYDNHVNNLLVANDEAVFMDQLMFDLKTGEKSRTWYKNRSWGAKRWKHDYLISGQGRDTSAVFPFGFLHDRKYGSQLERYHSTHWYYRGITGLILSYTDDTVYGVDTNRRMRAYAQLFAKRPDASSTAGKESTVWSVKVRRDSIQALLPAGPTLFAAGPTQEGGVLTSYSAKDGNKLAELPFDDAPAFDGLAVSGGRLYLATQKGRVFCFGGR